jgi:hypothetical protein
VSKTVLKFQIGIMSARAVLAFTLVGLAGAFGNAAETTSCPDSITTRQELTSSANGWSPLLDDTPHNLAGITFYDGPAAEKASLAYGSIKRVKGEDIATWTFAKQEDRRIWLVCSYAGTVVELSRSLPPQITTCTVTYDTQTHIAGLPAIRKISCR